MKLLNFAVVITGLCDLALAVPGTPGSAVSSRKLRRRCSKHPHSLATSKTRSYHTLSTIKSQTVTIRTSTTKSQTVTIRTSTTKSTTTTGPPGTTTSAPPTTTTSAPPDTTTTAPPDTTTTAPPDTTTTAPPDTTTTAPPDTTTTAPPDTTTTAPPDTTTTAPPDTTTAPPDTTTTAPPTTTTAPPPGNTCALGTGFGYRPPVNGVVQSTELDTTDGDGCNRWGWYTTPTLEELMGGVSGQILVGAGNNNVNAATNVGTYTAVANALGGVTVTYLLTGSYALAEVHVDLECLPIDTCAPGQYTYGFDEIPNLQTWSNPVPLQYPTCGAGSEAYLIVHAAVVEFTTEACEEPEE